MNWFLAILVLYIVIKAVWSYKRGFARMLLSLFTTFLALFLVWIFAPAVKNVILEHTDARAVISDKLEKYRSTGIHELSGSIAELLISAAAYAGLYLLLRLGLLIAGYILRLVTRIPGIRQMDGLAGMALGLLEAYILIGIVFILITALAHTGFGMTLMKQINESAVLTFMFNHNYLLRIISL